MSDRHIDKVTDRHKGIRVFQSGAGKRKLKEELNKRTADVVNKSMRLTDFVISTPRNIRDSESPKSDLESELGHGAEAADIPDVQGDSVNIDLILDGDDVQTEPTETVEAVEPEDVSKLANDVALWPEQPCQIATL